jgi:ABC-type polysaccharide/polyol phosphate transport system ATPase subunit
MLLFVGFIIGVAVTCLFFYHKVSTYATRVLAVLRMTSIWNKMDKELIILNSKINQEDPTFINKTLSKFNHFFKN